MMAVELLEDLVFVHSSNFQWLPINAYGSLDLWIFGFIEISLFLSYSYCPAGGMVPASPGPV
jgi:hypothetical protein